MDPRAEGWVDPGSFRDPSGTVFHWGERVFRTVNGPAASDFAFIRDAGILDSLIVDGLVIGTTECPPGSIPVPRAAGSRAEFLLEHTPIPFVSYPYEWPFSALQKAALLHLDLQIRLLESSASLSDASAYNVQFLGSRPVFIDVLSIRRYTEGEFWLGHRQFCEQFLNPLLLQSCTGLPYNDWYRGQLEGITSEDLVKAVPLWRRFSPNALLHVSVQAGAQRRSARHAVNLGQRRLEKRAYEGMLKGLRSWISGLRPRGVQSSTWADYAENTSYATDERAGKVAAVRRFAQRLSPAVLLDIGCNTGEFSQLAIDAGASCCIGLDADHGALHRAVDRAATHNLPFLPLYMNLANPSPQQGWAERERKGLLARSRADAAMALALVHHLAIGRNVPLLSVVEYVSALAPNVLIEFVPKNDPMVQLMLRNREDIFPDYTLDSFRSALLGRSQILSETVISESGRTLFEIQRLDG